MSSSPAMSDPMTPPAEVREALAFFDQSPHPLDVHFVEAIRAHIADLERQLAETWEKHHATLLAWERETYRVSEAEAQLTEANALRERDGKDAVRYRFLRDHYKREWQSDMPETKGETSLDISFEAAGTDLDAAIDAAIQARKQEKENPDEPETSG